MGKKLFVGNIANEASEEALRDLFESVGEVSGCELVIDKYSGRFRGFAFVEMPSVSEGQAAISALNGKTFKDRTLTVDAARPRSDSRGGGSYGDRRGGGSYGGRRRY